MNNYFISNRKKIEDFIDGDEAYILIKGTKDNFKDNLFCKLLWPTRRANIKLSFNFILAALAYIIPFSNIKVLLYRAMGMKIGKGVFFGVWVKIDPSYPELIDIGENTLIGMGAKIAVHDMTHDTLRLGRVSIGKNAIIGGYSLIRCGIKIGDKAVTGIGSVVYKNVPSGAMVTGNPARMVKESKNKNV